MNTLLTALKAEHIKKRGTALYLISFTFGAFLPASIFAVRVAENRMPETLSNSANFFEIAAYESMYPFTGFVLPLLIILIVSRITQFDHRNGGWHLMETQPLTRSSIYFSKFGIVMMCQIIAILSLLASSFFFAWLASAVLEVPLTADTSFPTLFVLRLISRLFVASLFIASLQYVIAVRMPAFLWSIGIGVAGMLLNLYLVLNKINIDWYPFQVLMRIGTFIEGSDLGYWLVYTEYVSLLGTALLLYIGYEWYNGGTLRSAFYQTTALRFKHTSILVVGVALLALTLKEKVLAPHSRTIIAGVIDKKMTFQTAYLINPIVRDTLARIPIKNNRYKYVLKGPLLPDEYTLVLDRGFQVPISVYMGDHDSVYVVSHVAGGQLKNKIYGTRLAENQHNSPSFSGDLAYYVDEYANNPTQFTRKYLSELDQSLKVIRNSQTVDNVVPRADYTERVRKLIYIRYLNSWNSYVKKRGSLFPGAKTPVPERLAEMKNAVSLKDEPLLSESNYRNYVVDELTRGWSDDGDRNKKVIRAIVTRLPAGSFRDKLLYDWLNTSLQEASSAPERSQLMARYLPQLASPRFKRTLVQQCRQIESLSMGQVAPDFEAANLDSRPFSLSDFKGSYVVLDIWATWCGPCKHQSPYFEKFALKYKNEPIRFISVSTDEKITDWLSEARGKSPSVMQLHLNDTFSFARKYNLESIPRFILIDREGKFVNSRLPYPSETAFELLLRNVLKMGNEEGV